MMAKYIDVMMLVIRFKFKDVGCCGRDTLVRGSEVAECSYQRSDQYLGVCETAFNQERVMRLLMIDSACEKFKFIKL